MYKKIKITERQLKNIVLNHLITEEDSNENNIPNKRILKVGRVGEDVRKLQQRLKDLGYGNLLGNSGPNRDGVDSKYGSSTKKAVEKYQEDTPPLEKDGVAGEVTIGKLNGVSNSKKTPTKEIPNKKTPTKEIPNKKTPTKEIPNKQGDGKWVSKITTSPFKSKYEVIKYRDWLNKYLPKVAEKYDVDKSVDLSDKFINSEKFYNNNNIINSLNQIVKYGEMYKSFLSRMNYTIVSPDEGADVNVFNYYKLQNPMWKSKSEVEEIETGKYTIPNTIKGADRINKELYYINKRPKYNNKGFFIVDPRLNLVLAFDENHKLIDYSESVASGDRQKDVVFTYEDWCALSENEWVEGHCYKKGVKVKDIADYKQFYENGDKKKGDLKYEDVKPKMNYDILNTTKNRYAAKGRYKVKSRDYNHYYNKGAKGTIDQTVDTYGLETEDGVDVGTAIHAIVDVSSRTTPDKKLREYLNKELSNGAIPKEYIDMVEKDFLSGGKEFDKSAGCFNVDPKFATNPKVQNMAQKGVYVFIMSEKDTDYLVQVEPGKEGQYLLDLNGKDGKCISPSSLENKYGTTINYDDIT